MEYKQRKRTRLPDFDYATPSAYFVTVCTRNRSCWLSNIVGAIHESPANILSAYGEIVKDIIEVLPERFPITIDNYIIMPNHIHLLLSVISENEKNRAIRESPLHRERSVISKAIGYLKMNASKRIHEICSSKELWQRGYHDHIVRGQEDYQNIWDYIDTNILRWDKDKYFE